MTEGQQMLQQKSELYEKTIAKLRQEVESLKSELKTSKETSNEPSSLLMHLQKELLDLKVALLLRFRVCSSIGFMRVISWH